MTRSFRSHGPPVLTGSHLLAIIACFVYFVGRAPFAGQWDSFDYLKQISTHRLSDLGLGRPYYIGYNIILWESARRLFALGPLQVETVTMCAAIAAGALGVLLFDRLARELLPLPAARLATLVLLISPVYAFYAGSIMTEVPMLVAMLASALAVLTGSRRAVGVRDTAAGVLFGVAVGIREQALFGVGSLLWLIWIRRPDLPGRIRSSLRFGISSLLVASAPLALAYWRDLEGLEQRWVRWIRVIPTGAVHSFDNFQAVLLYTLALSPAAWLGLAAAVAVRCGRRFSESRAGQTSAHPTSPLLAEAAGIRSPVWGLLLSLVLPLMGLLRNADVQIHPRYVLIALPASAMLCGRLIHACWPSRRAAGAWTALLLSFFGLSQLALQPFRDLQREKRGYADLVRENTPDEALLLAGTYSPVFDYYRAAGVRPGWRVLWSGWEWDERKVRSAMLRAWDEGVPVLLCDGPAAWNLLETERLGLHGILQGLSREALAPGLYLIVPPQPRKRASLSRRTAFPGTTGYRVRSSSLSCSATAGLGSSARDLRNAVTASFLRPRCA